MYERRRGESHYQGATSENVQSFILGRYRQMGMHVDDIQVYCQDEKVRHLYP